MNSIAGLTKRFIQFVVLASISSGAWAFDLDQTIDFNISKQKLDSALVQFSEQAKMQVISDSDQVKDFNTDGIVGRYKVSVAIKTLLRRSGLSYKPIGQSAISIGKFPAGAGQSTTQNALDGPSANTAVPMGNTTLSLTQYASATSESQPGPTGPEANQGVPGNASNSNPGIPEILVYGAPTMDVDVTRTENDVQPYTIFKAAQIEQSGATNVEDFLKQQLTMDTTFTTNSQVSPNYGTGQGTTSSINLRGLGSNETLILIDGRRSAGVSINGVANQPDINGIPLAAIDRIEVLPSSASAIYGGAAVGGVINIILKKNFNGGDLRYTYDKPLSSGANQRTLSGSYGFTLEQTKTQVLLGGGYSDGRPLLLEDRVDLEQRGISSILTNSPSYFYDSLSPFPGAATNIASIDGTYNSSYTVFTPTPLTLKNGTPLNSTITWVPRGTAPGSSLSAGLLANAGSFNLGLAPGVGPYALESPFGFVPLTKSAFVTIRQTLFDNVQVFTELSTNGNQGNGATAPFGRTFNIPSTASINPFQQDVAVNFPSTVSAESAADSTTKSATVGAIVPLMAGWSSELDYTWSKNTFHDIGQTADNTALSAAINAGTVNPFVDTVAYPLNLTPYLAPDSFSSSATLDDLALRASGAVGSLPAGRPTLTVGLEHRKEGSDNSTFSSTFPLTPSQSFEQTLFGQSQTTNSVYAEALVPLIAAKNNVPAVHALELQIAGRSERYSVETGTPYAYELPVAFQALNPPAEHDTIRFTSTNPTVGLKYQPVADVSLRASYSTAFLPPTSPQLLPNPTVCVSCGLIVDPHNGETYIVNSTQGGNPNLKPQTSRNWDFGAIFEPQEEALRGLRLNLEYYKITQPNYITTPTFQQFVDDPAFASHVIRDPTTGLVTQINISPVNGVEYATRGWDLKVDYQKPTAFGTVGLHAAATFITYDQRQLAIEAPSYNYAGYPNDGGEAKIKANATARWDYRHWTVAWTATYYSSYWQEGAPGSPSALVNGAPFTTFTDAQGGYTIPSQIYHDVFVSYVFEKASPTTTPGDKVLSNLMLSFGVKNVFNTWPPFDAAFEPYYYSPYGDPRLREFRLSVRKSF
jgi:iron complex outermembrane receptor protein